VTKILLFPGHRLDRTSRHYTEGGLAHCLTCGGAEGDLTQDCPQRRTTDAERLAVAQGELDFRRSQGGWTTWTRAKEMAARRRLT
jgi:hypothetical protein